MPRRFSLEHIESILSAANEYPAAFDRLLQAFQRALDFPTVEQIREECYNAMDSVVNRPPTSAIVLLNGEKEFLRANRQKIIKNRIRVAEHALRHKTPLDGDNLDGDNLDGDNLDNAQSTKRQTRYDLTAPTTQSTLNLTTEAQIEAKRLQQEKEWARKLGLTLDQFRAQIKTSSPQEDAGEVTVF
jgi:hypothetical protein